MQLFEVKPVRNPVNCVHLLAYTAEISACQTFLWAERTMQLFVEIPVQRHPPVLITYFAVIIAYRSCQTAMRA